MWNLLSRVTNAFAAPKAHQPVVPEPYKGPVFYKLTMPDGRVISCMREDAFRKALGAGSTRYRELQMNDILEKKMQRRGDWIQTYKGKQFWPLDPRPEDIDIQDIAHALSLLCRFNGHCTRFYSVSEHSVLVSHYVPPEQALWGLLHDAAEAYTSDIPRPLKRCLPDWKPMEDRIMAVVCEKFGLDPVEPDDVRRIDLAITTDEKAELMNPCVVEWSNMLPPLGVNIIGMEPALAEAMFLKRFRELTS
jgi:hypothetical protein